MIVYLRFRMKSSTNIQQLLSPKRLFLPIAIGIGVIGYLFYKDFDAESFKNVKFGWDALFWLFAIILLVCIRQLAYMYRIRILSGNELSFKQSFEVITLWEFASAISPSAVGGSAVAMFILNKEGIKLGKSTTIAITTLFLDLLVFVLLSMACYFILGSTAFFGHSADCATESKIGSTFFNNIHTIYWIAIIAISAFLLVIYYGVFVNARNFKRFIIGLFNISFLKKWLPEAIDMTNDLGITATELRTKSFGFWAQVLGASAITWTARFLLVNPVLAMFNQLNLLEHLTIYGRNFVLWLVMLVPTTPGASGVSEATLGELICQFIPILGLSPVILLIWRFFDYFIYLIAGIIILPKWLRRTFAK